MTNGSDKTLHGPVSELEKICEKRATELSRMNARFSLATTAARLGVWDWDIPRNELVWDDMMYELYGIKREDFSGAYEAWLQGIHPDDRAASDEASKRARSGEEEYDTEFRVVWPDGSVHYLKAYGQIVRDADDSPLRMTGINFDITERKHAEETLRRLNRELRAISNCNQVLVRAEDELTLFRDICRIICDEAGYRMAWVGYAEHDDAKAVRPVAWAGVEDGYLAQANITWADTELGRGPSGTAIRSGESACIQDFATVPQAAPWRDTALQRGYRSSIALPLKDENGLSFGVLNIYSSEPNAFTADETRLMDELSDDLAFGVMALRARTERKQAEEALYKAQQMYRALIENSPDIIARYDRDCRRTYVNPAYLKVANISPQELLATAPGERSPLPAASAAVLQNLLHRVLDSGVAEVVDVIWPKPDNIDYWYNIYAFPELDREGHIVSVMTVSRDITGRKRVEDELNRLNEELEQRVRERTKELERRNYELEQMNKVFVGRELKMVELKKRVEELERDRI